MCDKTTTIAAISTPLGTGGVGIIRVSGPEAVFLVDRLFTADSGKRLSDSAGYRAHLGLISDGKKDIDRVICTVFREPYSYTGENVVEINCHGGIFITKRILRAVLDAGAAPALPGEFTKRAFLNGKMDLTEAESVMTLISAAGEQGAGAAFNLLEGSLSKKIRSVCDLLVGEAAHIAAWTDYPDDDVMSVDMDKLYDTLVSCSDSLSALLNRYDAGMAVTSGVDAVIVGKPNVGKSTLMNLLTGFEKSIVTDIEGTTRDVIEETVNLNGCLLRLSDTAGLRETEDTVEKIGVDRSMKKLERAAVIFAVFDTSRPLSGEDLNLIECCKGRNVVPVLNKSDLNCEAEISKIEKSLGKCIYVSALTGEGYDELCDRVALLVGTKDFDTTYEILANERQRICCRNAYDALIQAENAVRMQLTLDAINVCIDDAVRFLLELTGEKVSDRVVDEIFSRFCVGK